MFTTHILISSTMISMLYCVHYTYINLFHDNFHTISCSTHIYESFQRWFPRYIVFTTHILISSTMISTLYRVQHTYINLFHNDFHAMSWKKHTYIKDNPFHDDTTVGGHRGWKISVYLYDWFPSCFPRRSKRGIVGNVIKTRCSLELCTCSFAMKYRFKQWHVYYIYIYTYMLKGVVSSWWRVLQLPMQSMPITTNVASSNLALTEVYNIMW